MDDANELQRLQKIANEAHRDVYSGKYGDRNKLQHRAAELQREIVAPFKLPIDAYFKSQLEGLNLSGFVAQYSGVTDEISFKMPPYFHEPLKIDMRPFVEPLNQMTAPLSEMAADFTRRFNEQFRVGLEEARKGNTAVLDRTFEEAKAAVPDELAEEIREASLVPAMVDTLDKFDTSGDTLDELTQEAEAMPEEAAAELAAFIESQPSLKAKIQEVSQKLINQGVKLKPSTIQVIVAANVLNIVVVGFLIVMTDLESSLAFNSFATLTSTSSSTLLAILAAKKM